MSPTDAPSATPPPVGPSGAPPAELLPPTVPTVVVLATVMTGSAAIRAHVWPVWSDLLLMLAVVALVVAIAIPVRRARTAASPASPPDAANPTPTPSPTRGPVDPAATAAPAARREPGVERYLGFVLIVVGFVGDVSVLEHLDDQVLATVVAALIALVVSSAVVLLYLRSPRRD